ncbi:ribonuclease E inhibitor RraB (plasmid) [Streptomyces sp. HU2014]|uniref:ribonuclease E inhibitor RraB n=1 Tax=Streptomyces sp. HU2014 TaxID=2939414 RepID=UPI00200FB64A|nr:ribonuclease E inhibitor RraB [Streptomyces sp. HU2014]UQI49822.1 ribonuclease E inhibitor RraB [Streptomyces sp. HU2014]
MTPYTHWAYFPDQESARRCAGDLADYVTRIRKAEGSQWLLLAGRDVETARLEERHAEVEAIVKRHGGDYDGGEATYLAGKPVVDPMLTDEPDSPPTDSH